MTNPSRVGLSLSALGSPQGRLTRPTLMYRIAAPASWPVSTWNKVILNAYMWDEDGLGDYTDGTYISPGGWVYITAGLAANYALSFMIKVESSYSLQPLVTNLVGSKLRAGGAWTQGIMYLLPGERLTVYGYYYTTAGGSTPAFTHAYLHVIPFTFLDDVVTPKAKLAPFMLVSTSANQTPTNSTWMRVAFDTIDASSTHPALFDPVLNRVTLPRGWYMFDVELGERPPDQTFYRSLGRNGVVGTVGSSCQDYATFQTLPTHYADISFVHYSAGDTYFDFQTWTGATHVIAAGSWMRVTPLPWLDVTL